MFLLLLTEQSAMLIQHCSSHRWYLASPHGDQLISISKIDDKLYGHVLQLQLPMAVPPWCDTGTGSVHQLPNW